CDLCWMGRRAVRELDSQADSTICAMADVVVSSQLPSPRQYLLCRNSGHSPTRETRSAQNRDGLAGIRSASTDESLSPTASIPAGRWNGDLWNGDREGFQQALRLSL